MPPLPFIEYFSLGYNESLASLLWIRLIQDIDICDKPKVLRNTLKEEENLKSSLLSSLSLHNLQEKQFLSQLENTQKGTQRNIQSLAMSAIHKEFKVCKNSWAYQMLNAITRLSPRFYVAYSIGGVTLSILVEDPIGAKIIFDRGLENFPEDWRLLYRNAYHSLFEFFDFERASELLKKAGDHGAPLWVYSLSSRLKTKKGQKELALSVLNNFRMIAKDKKVKDRIERKIQFFEEYF